MVLMQVEFSTAMKGRMGTGQADDRRQTKQAEFFGNIELLRSKVLNDGVMLDPDQQLSEDGFYLTSQMLRVTQYPPPPGSPEKAPARTFAKAWDEVHVNKGKTFSIVSDVGTYDSTNDEILAYGENGHQVTVLQQVGAGQPISQFPARAVQYNVKTHNWSDGRRQCHADRQRQDGRPAHQHPAARSDRPGPEAAQAALQGPEHQPRTSRVHRLLSRFPLPCRAPGDGGRPPSRGPGSRPGPSLKGALRYVEPDGDGL